MRIIRSFSPDAETKTGFKKSARAKKIADGLLPPTIVLGGKARGFIEEELDAVLSARANGADDNAIRKLVTELVAARSAKVAA